MSLEPRYHNIFLHSCIEEVQPFAIFNVYTIDNTVIQINYSDADLPGRYSITSLALYIYDKFDNLSARRKKMQI